MRHNPLLAVPLPQRRAPSLLASPPFLTPQSPSALWSTGPAPLEAMRLAAYLKWRMLRILPSRYCSSTCPAIAALGPGSHAFTGVRGL